MTIIVSDNFLPVELLNQCETALLNLGWKFGWHSHRSIEYTHWHHEILGGDWNNRTDRQQILLNHRRKDYDSFKTIWRLLRPMFENSGLLRCYANQHTYGVEGYPHTDSDIAEDRTILFYMNRQWDIAWGGETAFYSEGEIIQSVMPRFGRMVIFPSSTLHAARNVTRLCPKGRITLIFKVSNGAKPPVC